MKNLILKFWKILPGKAMLGSLHFSIMILSIYLLSNPQRGMVWIDNFNNFEYLKLLSNYNPWIQWNGIQGLDEITTRIFLKHCFICSFACCGVLTLSGTLKKRGIILTTHLIGILSVAVLYLGKFTLTFLTAKGMSTEQFSGIMLSLYQFDFVYLCASLLTALYTYRVRAVAQADIEA